MHKHIHLRLAVVVGCVAALLHKHIQLIELIFLSIWLFFTVFESSLNIRFRAFLSAFGWVLFIFSVSFFSFFWFFRIENLFFVRLKCQIQNQSNCCVIYYTYCAKQDKRNTQQRKIFEAELFSQSINICSMNIYNFYIFVCLSGVIYRADPKYLRGRTEILTQNFNQIKSRFVSRRISKWIRNREGDSNQIQFPDQRETNELIRNRN